MRALIVVDVQNDFLPGGALAVAGGDAVVPVANRLMAASGCAVLTADWHPAGHLSFACNHPGAEPFSVIDMPYGKQVLWPAHCVAGTAGAGFAPGLEAWRACAVVRKGMRAGCDSYSGFMEADRRTPTGLAGYLRERGVDAVDVCGLATDFCVAWTAMDAAAAGFAARIVTDASRAIDAGGSLAAARAAWLAAGVAEVSAAELLG
ncbi:MAG: nicotinamidase [Duodenibacillus sp.]|nr:nicotinamidase [Duodenibacillus sp.]